MKSLLKAMIAAVLITVARAVVRRYKPKIVMVTGSVGKTTTKDAVAAVLASRFFVRKSEKNFNTEFGVPFTIFDINKNPVLYPAMWVKVVKQMLGLLLLPNHYPNLLVLEVGADKPGDLSHILRIAAPDAVVVTRLPEIPVHVEAYASPEQVREEEFSPAYALAPGAPLIICADDPYALDSAIPLSARIITYGTASDAAVRLSEARFYKEAAQVRGMEAAISVGSEEGTLTVKGSVGATQLLPAAAAVAVAGCFGLTLSEALASLEKYEPPPGRGRLFAGVHGSIIIDDSYNASPAAVEEALSTLKAFPGASRRVAILGDMLELGRYSVIEHERIGKLARATADIVVSVGIRSRAFAASEGNTETMIFNDAHAAALALPGLIKEGDVILIKGSQSIRTERIVEALLVDPKDVARLVRQDPEWLKRP